MLQYIIIVELNDAVEPLSEDHPETQAEAVLHYRGVVLGQVYIYMEVGRDRWCLVRCMFTWEGTRGAWSGIHLHGNRQVVLGQVCSCMGTDRWCLVRCTFTWEDRWCLVRCTVTWEQTGGAWSGVQLRGNRQVVLGKVYSYTERGRF